MACVALDIGGANVKFAADHAAPRSVPFALWENPHNLTSVLDRELHEHFPDTDTVLAVMTGELADCFEDRETGVLFIARALQKAAGHRPVRWFGLDRQWHPTEQVFENPRRFAASNWLALALAVAQTLGDRGEDPLDALLIDIGTTTTDITPIRSGNVDAHGFHDTDRLRAGELLYVGVERTPICAIADHIRYRGDDVPCSAEWFATTLDVCLLLGMLPERTDSAHTADARPATREAARRRLGRTILAIGRGEFTEADAQAAADDLYSQLVDRVASALQRMAQTRDMSLHRVIVAGKGSFLAEAALQRLGVSHPWAHLAQWWNASLGNCDTSMALLRLWRKTTSCRVPIRHGS